LALAFAFFVSGIQNSPRALARLWFFVGLGYFAVSLRWIVEPFLVDIARHGWMAPFAIVLMASGFALFWGVAIWAIARRGTILSIIVAIAVAEVTRSLVLTGFPWALLGHVWVETPIAQLGAFIGPHGLTLVTLTLSAMLALVARRRWLFALALPAFAAAWVFLQPPPAAEEEGRPIVRFVHANIPQEEKWAPELRGANFDRLLQYTQSAEPVDLVIWPESAVTELMENAGPAFDIMSDVAGGAPLITGVQRRSAQQIYHNSFVVLGRGGVVEGVYDKQHLVPFGEYIPGGELAARIGIRGLAATEGGGFTAGAGETLLTVPGIGRIRPLICYEAIFPEEVRTREERPDLMVIITNDGWFGTGPGPIQHLAHARLRAIEFGLPVLRSANSGVSAVINGYGQVTAQIGLEATGGLDAAIPAPLPPTLYARSGDALILVLLLILFGATRVPTRKSIDPQGPAA